MSDETLFEMPEARAAAVVARVPTRPQDARVVRAVRNQVQWMARDLEALLPTDHPARAIWGYLELLDLTAFYAEIKAVLDRPGRPCADPRVLLGLWLLATAEGVGSARQVARLCDVHDAYRWMSGGVGVNYHTLSDFRVAHQAALNDLLTQILASLANQGLLQLQTIAQDGVRVRASAGKASFRGRTSLEAHLQVARAQVARLAAEREHLDPQMSSRRQQAQERAARERQARLERALADLPALQAVKEQTAARRGKGTPVKEAHASRTDPQARVMRMGDGGFRPAYNIQVGSEVVNRFVIGVEVTNAGTDAGLAVPMRDQVVERTGQTPRAQLIDGGFVDRADITTPERQGTTVYAPVRPTRRPDGTRAPPRPSAGDTPEVAAWQARMSTDAAKEIYKQRASTAEWVNAQFRQRHGLTQFNVRGIAKVTCVVLLIAITHDLLRLSALTAT